MDETTAVVRAMLDAGVKSGAIGHVSAIEGEVGVFGFEHDGELYFLELKEA